MRPRCEDHVEEMKTDKFHQVVAPTTPNRLLSSLAGDAIFDRCSMTLEWRFGRWSRLGLDGGRTRGGGRGDKLEASLVRRAGSQQIRTGVKLGANELSRVRHVVLLTLRVQPDGSARSVARAFSTHWWEKIAELAI